MVFRAKWMIATATAIAMSVPALAQDATGQNLDKQLEATASPINLTSLVAAADAEAADCGPAKCTTSASCGDSCFSPQNCCTGWMHQWDECKWIKIGAGIRASYNNVENGAANGTDAHDFNVDNTRIYMSGQGHPFLGFELNTDINNAQGFVPAAEMRVLDAVVKMKLTDNVNLWAGRLLPPSDRSNLDGPFFLNVYSFPWTQFGMYNIFQGRDDGAALWGQTGGGQFKWQVGLFDGAPAPTTGDDNLMFTGRVVLNLLDPEPGYYNASTYYGEKEILALGMSLFHQQDVSGTAADPRAYTAWNLDFLFETTLENCGVATLEAAYYDFDDDDAVRDGLPSATQATDAFGSSRQGESYFITALYLMPDTICIGNLSGRLQPHYRYQEYDRSVERAGSRASQWDLGVHYIMDGHNARLTAVYEHLKTIDNDSQGIFRLGAQVQF